MESYFIWSAEILDIRDNFEQQTEYGTTLLVQTLLLLALKLVNAVHRVETLQYHKAFLHSKSLCS